MNEPDDSGPVVLYVGGTGRSGSTLLAAVLGGLPDAVDVGEVRYLWQRGLLDGRLCGCGVPVPDCPFWTAVLERAYADRPPDPAAVHAALTRATRLRRLPAWMWRRPDPGVLVDVLPPLYAAIAATAGARVVVDSSKLPTYAALLACVLPTPPRMVHLVRDPRAAAYSWRAAKPTRDGSDTPLMERRGVVRSAALWLVWNRALAALWRDRADSAQVRYEELALDPRPVVARAAALAGLGGVEHLIGADGSFERRTAHTVAGNPERLSTGRVRIVADERWRRGLEWGPRLAVTGITLPVLRRFGYPLRAPR
ncbi:MAG: sulfotransferase [Dermatophilaceae bacterium]